MDSHVGALLWRLHVQVRPQPNAIQAAGSEHLAVRGKGDRVLLPCVRPNDELALGLTVAKIPEKNAFRACAGDELAGWRHAHASDEDIGADCFFGRRHRSSHVPDSDGWIKT